MLIENTKKASVSMGSHQLCKKKESHIFCHFIHSLNEPAYARMWNLNWQMDKKHLNGNLEFYNWWTWSVVGGGKSHNSQQKLAQAWINIWNWKSNFVAQDVTLVMMPAHPMKLTVVWWKKKKCQKNLKTQTDDPFQWSFWPVLIVPNNEPLNFLWQPAFLEDLASASKWNQQEIDRDETFEEILIEKL